RPPGSAGRLGTEQRRQAEAERGRPKAQDFTPVHVLSLAVALGSSQHGRALVGGGIRSAVVYHSLRREEGIGNREWGKPFSFPYSLLPIPSPPLTWLDTGTPSRYAVAMKTNPLLPLAGVGVPLLLTPVLFCPWTVDPFEPIKLLVLTFGAALLFSCWPAS